MIETRARFSCNCPALDGQAAAFSITEKLRPYSAIRVTRFAHGVPIGGELKYLDEVTLSMAFNLRQAF